MKYLKKFDRHADYEAYKNGQDYLTPNVSWCVDLDEVHFNKYVRDYSKEYFTIEALENGTISFNIWESMGTEYITSISYSTDNGETWTTTNNTNNKSEHLTINVNVNEGDKVLWKGDAQQMGYYDTDDYGDSLGSFFSSTSEFNVYGNIMSLLYGDNFYGKTVLEYDSQFSYLFSDYNEENECNVVNAENLSLPATILASNCYGGMFMGCTSLTTAPELPATILASNCYGGMFNGCTSLTTAPELHATTLAHNCCNYMFFNCTSLTTAPELPAITLADSCYYSMFLNCTGLTTAPELPATILTSNCYGSMFNGCTRLNYIKAMFTTTPSISYTLSWVINVSSTGTFVKNSAATWNESGVNGVPTGWTIETASA